MEVGCRRGGRVRTDSADSGDSRLRVPELALQCVPSLLVRVAAGRAGAVKDVAVPDAGHGVSDELGEVVDGAAPAGHLKCL